MKVTLPASLVASARYEDFAQGPGKRHGRSNSLKWPWLYDKLRAKGYDKSKAAAISNAKLSTRKKGRISVLTAKQAHSSKVLGRLAKADKAGKHSTRKALVSSARAVEFACTSKSCAPPPVGTGGSTKVNVKAVRGLKSPDSGFTLSTRMRPIRTGFAVALKGSDRLVDVEGGFENGKPTAKMVALVRDRLNAAVASGAPRGTKVALGAWHNPDDGKIEINVTVVFPRTKREAAIKFGQDQDQIAIAQLHDFEIISTGGTGGDRAVE